MKTHLPHLRTPIADLVECLLLVLGIRLELRLGKVHRHLLLHFDPSGHQVGGGQGAGQAEGLDWGAVNRELGRGPECDWQSCQTTLGCLPDEVRRTVPLPLPWTLLPLSSHIVETCPLLRFTWPPPRLPPIPTS